MDSITSATDLIVINSKEATNNVSFEDLKLSNSQIDEWIWVCWFNNQLMSDVVIKTFYGENDILHDNSLFYNINYLTLEGS